MAEGVKDAACLCGGTSLTPGSVQWVKDPALLQLLHRSRLQLGFEPWARNFYMLWGRPKKKKKKKKLPGENCIWKKKKQKPKMYNKNKQIFTK